jgi:spermidine synthase
MILRHLMQLATFFLFICPLSASVIYFSDPLVTKENLTFNPIHWSLLLDRKTEKYSFWFRDSTHRQDLEEQHFFLFNQLLAMGQTPFQEYAFINSKSYGKILFIDGEVQSSEQDEFIYHESLVHPAMIAHSCPQSILVIGAGEGAAAREILRYSSVKELVLVDIDGEIIQKCKELLKEWHQGSFEHPKAELLIMDGKKYIESKVKKFDIIFIDICDKLDNSPAAALYTQKFYQSVKEILHPNGIVVVQAMEFNSKVSKDHLIVHHNLQEVFLHTLSYGTYVPSFWSVWGFVIASDHPINLTEEEINATLKKRGLDHQLRHYDGETHRNMFSIPKELRKLLQKSNLSQ